MKIAVVDDEKLWLKRVEDFLEHYYSGREVDITYYLSGKSFLNENKKNDIILMDIEMPVINGFEAIERYKTRFPEAVIIILTTHDEYIKKGFIFEAFRYVDKTAMDKELSEALKSAERKLDGGKTMFLKVLRVGEVAVKIRDIIYIETMKRHVIVHIKKDLLLCGNTISEMEKELAEEGFFRVHRSYLINLRCVDSFCKTDIKMSNGDMAMLSARKSAEFKKNLMEYRYYIANG
jgi:DNA-binding LytR/AlgR family response regulator